MKTTGLIITLVLLGLTGIIYDANRQITTLEALVSELRDVVCATRSILEEDTTGNVTIIRILDTDPLSICD